MIAAPVIETENRHPLAYTDFASIFIYKHISNDERAVLLKHEQAHIWLQHNSRARTLAKIHLSKVDNRLLNIAFDTEIATHLYTPEDLSLIENPRTILHGGITRESVKGLTDDLLYAEEIYQWLLEHPESVDGKSSCDTDAMGEPKDIQESKDVSVEQVADLIEQAKDAVAEIESDQKSSAVVAAKCNPKNVKPSLASEIDAVLRARHEHIRCFRRPSRRDEDGIIKKGAINLIKRPKVEVYLDRSGSFTPDKTRHANHAVKVALSKYSGKIDHDVAFFGDDRLDWGTDKIKGGNTPYNLVVDAINGSKSDIAVIITDDDQCPDVLLKTPTKIIVIPIGCASTNIGKLLGAIEIGISGRAP